MKVLHLDSSIQGENSASRAISAEIVKAVIGENAVAQVTYRDLAASPLPHLTLPEFGSENSIAALEEFLAADVIVIGAGMYNFTIPSQLKAWIDRILIAGKTFQYTATGPEGLAGGRRVIVALARGGFYGEGSPAAGLEHAETYLRGAFAFIGIPVIEIVNADGLAIPDVREGAIAAATQRAAALAA